MKDSPSSLLVFGLEGTRPSDEERSFFTKEPPGGFIFFSRNIPPGIIGLKGLTAELSQISSSKVPFFMAVDQEGGRVSRLKAPFPNRGPAMFLENGRVSLKALLSLRLYGYEVGVHLRALGINVNFAPVLDILTRESNTSIGDRSFGRTPEAVYARAFAFQDGLMRGGVLSCLKHFPGQGDGSADTHLEGILIESSLPQLERRELYPFTKLAPLAPMVMLSHAKYKAFGSKEACRSGGVIHYLRNVIGFKSLIVSDDMNMKAIPQDKSSWKEALKESVACGVDLFLICRELEKATWAVEALREAYQKSPSLRKHMEASMERCFLLRKGLHSYSK